VNCHYAGFSGELGMAAHWLYAQTIGKKRDKKREKKGESRAGTGFARRSEMADARRQLVL
jgi:(p)ppGpp synthase/HD superfamily hydrolase